MPVEIKLYPEYGDVFYLILTVPAEKDEEVFINEFIDEYMKNITSWEFNT